MARSATDPCTYQLHIHLGHEQSLTIGRLGRFTFPAGEYVYTGSARRNIHARLARHCRSKKKLRWHIDYLLAAEGCEVVGTETFTTPECQLNRSTGGEIVAPGFGASDCSSDCGSHLKYTGNPG